MNRSVLRVLLGAAVVCLMLVVVPVASATTGTLVITSDKTLGEDHVGNIVVGTDGVILDCAGHSVSGGGTFGVLLSGRTGVSVKNCDVSGFAHGIGLLNSFNARI